MPFARFSYGLITSRNQGGGNKKQGLPPTMGLGPFSMNLIQRRAGYCKCDAVIQPPTVIPTILTYNDETQGDSFDWGGVTFTRNMSYPGYAYTAITTFIPGSQVPGFAALTSVIIGNSVITIGNSAFYICSVLTSVTIPNSVITIGDGAFNGCSALTSVTIGNSVTTIGAYAFNGCSGLASVTIGNSVITIGPSAFQGCSGLTSIAIPNSVITIGDFAFNGCSVLTTVYISAATAAYLGTLRPLPGPYTWTSTALGTTILAIQFYNAPNAVNFILPPP